MVEVFFILGIVGAFWYCECTPTDEILPLLAAPIVPAGQNPEILEAQGASTVANPDIFEHGSIRSK